MTLSNEVLNLTELTSPTENAAIQRWRDAQDRIAGMARDLDRLRQLSPARNSYEYKRGIASALKHLERLKSIAATEVLVAKDSGEVGRGSAANEVGQSKARVRRRQR